MAMGVKERKAIEKQMRRDQILDAARALLFSVGLNNISISKISKKAELGVGTIYFYYKSKEEIFVALQEEGLAILHAAILKISKKKIEQRDKLKEIATAYYNFSIDHKNYFDIINYFLSSPIVFFKPDLKNKIDMSGHKILIVIREIIMDGINKGVFSEDEPNKFSIMFWGNIHGLLQFKKLENTALGNEDHEKLYQYSVEKLINSLK
jgi:TetR/AcrR family transcriptional regulator